jgi:septation ring formation regulator EzrA
MNLTQLSEKQLSAEYAKANENYLELRRITPRNHQLASNSYNTARRHLQEIVKEFKRRQSAQSGDQAQKIQSPETG